MSSTKNNTLIAPEVLHDAFSEAIRNLARSASIDSVLEIGSSSGEGSTLAWVEGLRLNRRKPKLYCMEVVEVRCEALEKRWGQEGFIKFFHGSSVDLSQYSTAEEVEHFYRTVEGPLQKYPLEQVLGWRQQELDYIEQNNIPTGQIRRIKAEHSIEFFGAVLIDGSEFTGNVEMDEIYGAEFILLDDTQTFKCHAAHQRLLVDPGYALIEENASLRHGYSIFRRRHRTLLDPLPATAPVHYFTIVLNGNPFIRYHLEVLKKLSFPWHWHIVEGAATLTHDTAWSVADGGTLSPEYHRSGLSIDGTSEYLDEIARLYPESVTIYRKKDGALWDGKIEMIAEPLKHIFEDAILWQMDADELWTVLQLETARQMFLQNPEKSAAWFWCHFFVGENFVVSSRNCYSQNPAQEWLRAWSFRPGMRWLTHEPPVLAERKKNGTWENVAGKRDFTHSETEAAGLVFQHYAYVTEGQLNWKERYYGYENASDLWRQLQTASHFPTLLRDYLPWVKDDTLVDRLEHTQIVPLARRVVSEWQFFAPDTVKKQIEKPVVKIVVDCVFFQLSNTGISRVWLETFKQWASSSTGAQVWLLDRDGTAPQISGLKTRRMARFDPTQTVADAFLLQQVCDELCADVFISTYYTAPVTTKTVSMIYDMIPELLRIQDNDWQWREKSLCIQHATHLVCISHSTAHDLLRIYPEIPPENISVVPLAAPPEYAVPSAESIAEFRRRHGLAKDYLVVAGERVGIYVSNQGYKNVSLAFKAWSLLSKTEKESLDILCVGGKPVLEEEFRILAPDARVVVTRLSDEDLQLAYGGAVVLLYPSLYEGFGLPVIEAMACGCPVITCRRSSLTEVAGDAAVFVNPWNAMESTEAIRHLRQDVSARASYIERGIAQAQRFSFPRMATLLAEILSRAGAEKSTTSSRMLQLVRENSRNYEITQSGLLTRIGKLAADKDRAREQMLDLKTKLSAQKIKYVTTADALKKAKTTIATAKAQLKKQRARKLKSRPSPLRRLWRRIRGKSVD